MHSSPKQKWCILKVMLSFSPDTYKYIIITYMALHKLFMTVH
jgi:hypothetical protein